MRASWPRTRCEVDGQRLEAPRIFINVGGRAPSLPGIDGADAVPHYTSSTIMDVDFLPEHLVVVGGSYIGLEFGQMYRRFGSRGHHRRARAAPDRARGRGRLRRGARHRRKRGHRGAHRRQLPRALAPRATASPCGSTAQDGEPEVDRVARAARHRPRAQHRRPRPRPRRHRGRRARLHHGGRPAARPRRRASGRSATATAAARSPTPRTTISKSSPPTCSTAPTARSPTASPPTRSTSTRRSGAPG